MLIQNDFSYSSSFSLSGILIFLIPGILGKVGLISKHLLQNEHLHLAQQFNFAKHFSKHEQEGALNGRVMQQH